MDSMDVLTAVYNAENKAAENTNHSFMLIIWNDRYKYHKVSLYLWKINFVNGQVSHNCPGCQISFRYQIDKSYL